MHYTIDTQFFSAATFLGLFIDSNVTWGTHIDFLTKASQKVINGNLFFQAIDILCSYLTISE